MNNIRNKIQYLTALPLLLAFFMLANTNARAQRSDYQQLVQLSKRPEVNVDVFPLPGANGQLKLTTIFQFSNNFLPFKKLDNTNDSSDFYSSAQLTMEVFKSPRKHLRTNKQVDISGLESVGRGVWKDTAYVSHYDQTKLNAQGLNGSIQIAVSPGDYTYLLQLKRDRAEKSQDSRTRNVHLQAYNKEHKHNLFLVKKVNKTAKHTKLTLFNLGRQVIYNKDFYAFIHIPQKVDNHQYTIEVNRILTHRKDTTRLGTVYKHDLAPDQIMQNVIPQLQTNSKTVDLTLKKKQAGFNYALVKIPNKNFPNATYKLTIHPKGSSKPLVSGIFKSYWSDIPTSLLSLDVSIDMLRFITNKEIIKKINSGTKEEREKKFRQFWKEKDPTPKTQFNELEAEYYHRIDYAYDHFGSKGNPGYDTDRGKTYIGYGPPLHKSRKYPPDGPTTEIWTYKNYTFVFKATSGFGDYQLVSKEKN